MTSSTALNPPLDTNLWSQNHLAHVEQALTLWVGDGAPAGLGDAMRYAVLDGGKRLRPLLVLAAYEAARSGSSDSAAPEGAALDEAALRAACAVELIHAYSLVHDDMPCMDNDVLRRGKPTVHVQFGEAQALLAGDALQAFAFELLTPDNTLIPAATQAALCRLLARAAGSAGMAGGQAIDLASVGVALTEAQLRQMHRLKTDYGAAMGLAFQVVDDILDVVADSATLGKTAGKDAAADKPTYVSLLGLERAQAYAQELLAEAHAALGRSGLPDTRALAALADMVVRRSH